MASKRSSKSKKKNKSLFVALCVIIVIIVAAVIILYLVKPGLFKKAIDAYKDYVSAYYFDSPDDDSADYKAKPPAQVESGTLEDISQSEYSIHFLELGNKYTGDCTLIKCGDTEVLIDAGSRTSSADTINEYIGRYCTDGKLEYVIATHAHQDHIAGFVGKKSGETKTGVLYKWDIGTIIQFSRHNSEANVYKNYVEAVNYAEEKGAAVYGADQCWYERDGAKKQYDLSVAQDKSLTLNVLYNYYYENDTEDENDYSVCVLLTGTEAGGSRKNYLFTGDLEGKGEEYLVDRNDLPEVELFKGGHHGSKTSSTDKLLSVIKPKNVAVCCCAGSTEYTSNNDNTFPTQAFIDRISKYTQNVYCTSLCVDYKAGNFTSMNGDIVFYVKEGTLTNWFSNNGTLLKDTEWFKNNRKCPESWAGT